MINLSNCLESIFVFTLAVLFAISALVTRFWWRIPFIGPEGNLRPKWMHPEEANMTDASAGLEAATAAGISRPDDGTGDGQTASAPPPSSESQGPQEYLVCTEWVAPNYQLLVIFGLVFATAWQTQNMRIGAGVGGFFYLGSVFFGWLVWRAGLRKVPVYWQEVAIGSLLFLLWAISYPVKAGQGQNSPQALTIQNYFPFIVNAILAGLSLVGSPPMRYRGISLNSPMILLEGEGHPLKAPYRRSSIGSLIKIQRGCFLLMSDRLTIFPSCHPTLPHRRLCWLSALSRFNTSLRPSFLKDGPSLSSCLPPTTPPPYGSWRIASASSHTWYGLPLCLDICHMLCITGQGNAAHLCVYLHTTISVSLITCSLSQIAFQSHIQGHTNGQYRTGGTDGKDNGATIVFRIVVPIVLYIGAALFTRFWYIATRPPWAKPPPPQPSFTPAIELPQEEKPIPEDSSDTSAEEPSPEQQELDYINAYNAYMQQLWQQYEQYMQQYQIPPPPPPEPIKPSQASNVPRYALMPGQQPPMSASQTAAAGGTLGWGDEAHWANVGATMALKQQMQQPLARYEV